MKCPCNSNLAYQECCKCLHDGVPAASAEALMRSRFSAFVLHLESYLLRSWAEQTRPAELSLDANEKWQHLEIIASSDNGRQGQVELPRIPGQYLFHYDAITGH